MRSPKGSLRFIFNRTRGIRTLGRERHKAGAFLVLADGVGKRMSRGVNLKLGMSPIRRSFSLLSLTFSLPPPRGVSAL